MWAAPSCHLATVVVSFVPAFVTFMGQELVINCWTSSTGFQPLLQEYLLWSALGKTVKGRQREHVSAQSVQVQFLKGPAPPPEASPSFNTVRKRLKIVAGENEPLSYLCTTEGSHCKFSLRSKVSLWQTSMYRSELINSPQLGSWQLPSIYAAHREGGFCPAGAQAVLHYSWPWL